jgi:nitrate reductase gamma subunit
VGFLPPEVIGLLLGMAVVAGLALMIGMRISMRRELEPLSRSGRVALVIMILVVLGGAYVVYRRSASSTDPERA